MNISATKLDVVKLQLSRALAMDPNGRLYVA